MSPRWMLGWVMLALATGCASPTGPTYHVQALAAPLWQEPRPPYPYDEVSVRVPNRPAGITLAGTLTRPRGAGPFPAVLIITGSGMQSRANEFGVHKPYKLLADRLTRRGIAVLRLDDRGYGQSSGVFYGATTADFAGDMGAALDFLKARPDIDPARVGILGHSEGGMVASLVASAHPVAFVVLMASPGMNGAGVLEQQTIDAVKMNGIAYTPQDLAAMHTARLALEKERDPTRMTADILLMQYLLTHNTAKGTRFFPIGPLAIRSALFSVNPWYRYYFQLDPLPYFERVKAPVLMLNGTKDVQVNPSAHVPLIRGALEKGGNHDVTVRLLPGLNHMFQPAPTGNESEYGRIGETMDPQVPTIIADWILSKTRRP